MDNSFVSSDWNLSSVPIIFLFESDEPEYAPKIDTYHLLEANATDKEKKSGNFTEVTHLYLDRTPED